jgi:hypothetical protein
MIAETSTLWLNARFLCIISKRASNALFELVQLQFFLVFIFVRIVVAMGFLLPWWLKLAGGAYVKGVPNAPFELAELASGDFANFAKTDAPGWWWVFLTFNIVAMCCLNSMWAVGMVKIALGLGGGGDKKKGSKKKTKEDTFTGMNITPFNLLVYVRERSQALMRLARTSARDQWQCARDQWQCSRACLARCHPLYTPSRALAKGPLRNLIHGHPFFRPLTLRPPPQLRAPHDHPAGEGGREGEQQEEEVRGVARAGL